MAEPNPIDQLIEGKSDDQIVAGVKSQGVDKVLGEIFDGMKAAFVPDAAKGQSAVVQYDVTSPDGTHSYQIKVANGTCQITKGAGEPARVTLALALPDFLRLIAGKLDGMQAFMSGKLRLSGDMMFAQTMQSWFKRT